MYSFRVEDTAMREPHWHPINAELGYVHKGQARMTILDPDGSTDTYTLKPSNMYYIPAAYPHQIEVLPEGGREIHFCIFPINRCHWILGTRPVLRLYHMKCDIKSEEE